MGEGPTKPTVSIDGRTGSGKIAESNFIPALRGGHDRKQISGRISLSHVEL